jgi:hypothetical protein
LKKDPNAIVNDDAGNDDELTQFEVDDLLLMNQPPRKKLQSNKKGTNCTAAPC